MTSHKKNHMGKSIWRLFPFSMFHLVYKWLDRSVLLWWIYFPYIDQVIWIPLGFYVENKINIMEQGWRGVYFFPWKMNQSSMNEASKEAYAKPQTRAFITRQCLLRSRRVVIWCRNTVHVNWWPSDSWSNNKVSWFCLR